MCVAERGARDVSDGVAASAVLVDAKPQNAQQRMLMLLGCGVLITVNAVARGNIALLESIGTPMFREAALTNPDGTMDSDAEQVGSRRRHHRVRCHRAAPVLALSVCVVLRCCAGYIGVFPCAWQCRSLCILAPGDQPHQAGRASPSDAHLCPVCSRITVSGALPHALLNVVVTTMSYA
jgi:hypothetical protein